MTTVTLRGVPINFPFEPYPIQRDYMEKVIECLQQETNGVLESPTGTGKTLSLLCSTLAWLQLKKAQIQAQRQLAMQEDEAAFLQQINEQLETGSGKVMNRRNLSGLPKIIYASRTHSQLSQAMQEMKRTAYSYMKAVVLGSRDQMCIHPEVEKEENRGFKIMICQLKRKTRSCKFYNKIDTYKVSQQVNELSIMDIEDIVTLGKRCGFCPFYMAKELKDESDIIFMPYNYLLDPSIRKALSIDLSNSVVILDEAHNVERICEDSASLQIKSSDIALAIDEVTAIMKMTSEETMVFDDSPKDFDSEDLCNLKEVLLNLEKEIDNIDLSGKPDGLTLEGTYIFELLEKAGIHAGNYSIITKLISNIVQYLATVNEGPFGRRGNHLQMIEEILLVVFSGSSPEFKEKIKKCYKVYIKEEEVKKKRPDNWLSKMVSTKAGGKVINYWCFSPGFGMKLLMREGLRSLILTSGTLAPLKPLISELEINVGVRLENPHIINSSQVLVKIIPQGPDSEPLSSSFQNRDNPKYMNSLGMSILNITRMVPDGLLIFFPSYPIMTKCQQVWQTSGVWGHINSIKAIYVEPKDKNSFNMAMSEYYSKIRDPNNKGAIFMGVCRGKVSEGLDFADANGRTVIVTGLPFPPLKDPKIILKRQYLDRCNAQDKEFLKGQEWYSLEASRAVNQAIGRVIRHKDDYGAILLMDNRFCGSSLKNQMSLWIRNQVKVSNNFGELMKDLRLFFKTADLNYKAVIADKGSSLPTVSCLMPLNPEPSSSDDTGDVVIHKRNKKDLINPPKKLKLVPNPKNTTSSMPQSSSTEYILMVKKNLDQPSFIAFKEALEAYRNLNDLNNLTASIDNIFKTKISLKYLIPGLEAYIRNEHKLAFSVYCQKCGLLEV